MANNPAMNVDPDGKIAFIAVVAIGAGVGAIVNVATHWKQIKSGGPNGKFSWKNLGKAAAVGAAAGAVAVVAGAGAAAGLSALGVTTAGAAGGALIGVGSAAASSPVTGFGNQMAFGEKYTGKQFVRDVVIGGIAGGIVGGAVSAYKGNNVWTGKPVAYGRSLFSFNNTHRTITAANPKPGAVNIDLPEPLTTGDMPEPDPTKVTNTTTNANSTVTSSGGGNGKITAGSPQQQGAAMSRENLYAQWNKNGGHAITNGRLDYLGNSDDIFNNSYQIVADNNSLLQPGINDIRAVINNQPTTIRITVHTESGGSFIRSMNVIPGFSNRIVDNIINLGNLIW